MNIDDKVFSQKIGGENYEFSFEERVVGGQVLFYCYLYQGNDLLGQVRVNSFEGNNLEIHLNTPGHTSSKKNILLCRLLDRAIRPLGIKRIFILTLINLPNQENIAQILCHYVLFATLAGKHYLGCAEFEGGFLSCSSRGIMALELTQNANWNIQEKIKNARSNAEKFIDFLISNFKKGEPENNPFVSDEHLEKISKEQIKSVLDGENLPRVAVSNYLAANQQRLDPDNRQSFRKITIAKGPNRVDFQRGNTYVSSYVSDLQHKSGTYSSHYSFFRGRARRTIGHNNIIIKTIKKIVPPSLQIGIISEVIKSDGSTSMASISSQSMLLRHLGFNSDLVAGLSFGGFGQGQSFFPIIDINALEDKYGEVDCKIAASEAGIISIHMDTKSPLDFENFFKILELCKKPLLELIKIMKLELPEEYLNLPIPSGKAGLLVGKGGKNLNLIKKITGIKTLRVNGEILVLGKKNHELALKMIKPVLGIQTETIVLEIKNIDPLAIITGKVENRGLTENLEVGKIVEAKWLEGKQKPKVIEITKILE
jgi:hypothetical protein